MHDPEDPEPYPTVHDRQDLRLAIAISAAALVIVVIASVLVVASGA